MNNSSGPDANVKRAVRDALAGVADKVTFRRGGEMVARRGYFYRHGMDSRSFGAQVAAACASLDLKVTVSYRDVWNRWPRDSFFEATVWFDLAPAQDVAEQEAR